MKINHKKEDGTWFSDLAVGEVFTWGLGYFMKVDAEDTAVDIHSGNLHHFPEETLVHHLPNASLNLE